MALWGWAGSSAWVVISGTCLPQWHSRYPGISTVTASGQPRVFFPEAIKLDLALSSVLATADSVWSPLIHKVQKCAEGGGGTSGNKSVLPPAKTLSGPSVTAGGGEVINKCGSKCLRE